MEKEIPLFKEQFSYGVDLALKICEARKNFKDKFIFGFESELKAWI